MAELGQVAKGEGLRSGLEGIRSRFAKGVKELGQVCKGSEGIRSGS